MRKSLALTFAALVAVAPPCAAQLVEFNQVGVRMGHVHLAVTDVDAHTRFFTTALGGKVVTHGPLQLIEFPGVYVMLRHVEPAVPNPLPSKGRALDHIGFDVQDLDGLVRSLDAKGVTLEGPVRQVAGTNIRIAFLTDPWGTYIELTEGMSRTPTDSAAGSGGTSAC